jgi:hypothetical protein
VEARAVYNWVVGLSVDAGFLYLGLFLRIAISVNGALPPERRFPLREYRQHYAEIIRLHCKLFPKSTLRVTWKILGIIWLLLIGVAIAAHIQTTRHTP